MNNKFGKLLWFSKVNETKEESNMVEFRKHLYQKQSNPEDQRTCGLPIGELTEYLERERKFWQGRPCVIQIEIVDLLQQTAQPQEEEQP